MAARLQEVKDHLEKSLHDKSKPWTAVLDIMEAKSGVDRMYIFIGIIAFFGVYLVFGFGAQLVCNVLGFLYPAYTSIKAIESPQKDDDTKWLTYWVVFATFSLVEFFADIVASWFPLYWLAKCFFMVWLMMPTELNGSLVLYRRIIRPFFLKHSSHIDNTIDDISTNIKNQAHKLVPGMKSD